MKNAPLSRESGAFLYIRLLFPTLIGDFPGMTVTITARGQITMFLARRALAELWRVYWFPLYTFARRKGLGPEDAEDAAQTFLELRMPPSITRPIRLEAAENPFQSNVCG
jgi:hypothetical protein